MNRLTTGRGDAQWYALSVVVQKEYTAAHLLERNEGVWAFVPTDSAFRRRTRYSKGRVEYAKPEMPGCIVVRFDSEPIWYNVLDNNLVYGPLGNDGEIRELHDMVSFLARVSPGHLVLRNGTQLVSVNGREMRAPTSHKRVITKRAKGEDIPVVEARGRVARWLERYAIPQRAPLRAAA